MTWASQGESQKHGVPQMAASQDYVSGRTFKHKIQKVEGDDEDQGGQDAAEGDDFGRPFTGS